VKNQQMEASQPVMNGARTDLCDRTKNFALRVMRLYKALPQRADAQVLGRQLLRAATSVAANYRAAQRARSRAEFISKLCVVVEEADESQFWLELLRDGSVVSPQKLASLIREASELVAIFTAARSRTRR